MRLTTFAAFLAGLMVATWLSVLDRKHWAAEITDASVMRQYKVGKQ